MAGSITWEQLRELAGFRSEKGCAVSLYLGLDPSDVPTAGDLATRTRSLFSRAQRQLEERRATLSRGEREGLKADLERLAQWFEADFRRDGARGVAIFAAGLDNLFTPLSLPWAVEDDARIAAQLYLAPLVRLVGRGDGALVAYVGRERGDVYRLRAGQLVPLADQTTEVPGRHDQGGWSQARYERHIETIVDRHLRDVADALDTCVRRLRGVRVVLVGPEETRSGFEEILSHEVRSCLVGWASAEAHADPQRLLAAAQPLLDEWRTGRVDELLGRWREEAAKNGRAATGWEETLEAASDGRVELLLVQDGADQAAWECPACGRASMTDGTCPLDGTTLERADAGLDLAVHQTLTHGGTVEVIGEEHRDLEPVGGVAALLRF
ncbi:MAG TPA: Vms1/Ankzf1 family peptidyl-tRNA hydrolase [Gaiellaceae bacterium]|nr:Vms1/Ankzf1 family peptidyl-tRNA hydrolase [Gaiellaceae bacterium]